MLNPSEIAAHLNQAMVNEKKGFDAAQCMKSLTPSGKGIYPCCKTGLQVSVPTSIMFGSDRATNAQGAATKFGTFRTILFSYNENAPLFKSSMATGFAITADANREEVVYEWEQRLLDYLKPVYLREGQFAAQATYKDVKVNFLVERSVNDVIKESSSVEVHLLAIGVVVLLLYSTGLFAYCDWASRYASLRMALLVSAGFIAVAMSVLAGYGVMAFAGVKLTPANTVIPLIALGLGLDDLYILIHAYLRVFEDEEESGSKPQFAATYGLEPDAEATTTMSHIQLTMASAGPSILLTTLCNFIAFMLASLTPIRAVQTFCWQMAATVVFLFLFLLLTLVPLLVYACDGARGRPLAVCGTMRTAEEAPISPTLSPENPPRAPSVNGYISHFMQNYFCAALEVTAVKVCVVLLSLGLAAVGTWAAFTQTTVGLAFADIVTDGTYQHAFVEANFGKFYTYSGAIVTIQGLDYAAAETQTAMLAVQADVQGSRCVSQLSTVKDRSWFSNSSKSLLGLAAAASPSTGDNGNTPLHPAAFYPTFNQWIGSSGVVHSPSLVCRDKVTNKNVACTDHTKQRVIAASTQPFLLEDQVTTDDITDAIKDTRERCDRAKVKGSSVAFVYGYTYELWEQYLNIKNLLHSICGFTLIGIAGATMICQLSPTSSIWICVTILVINLECYGAISLLAVKLNAFSVVNLCISVGMAVEFTAHYSRAFLVADGDRNQRMRTAFKDVGAPMLSGAVSTFLSIVWFALSKVKFIKTYYFNMFAAVTFIAFFNGTVFLPVLLSLIGPSHLKLKSETAPDSSNPTVSKDDDTTSNAAAGDEHANVSSSAEAPAV